MVKRKKTGLLVVVLLLCLAVALSACGAEEPAEPAEAAEPESSEAPYRVSVVDNLGTPYTEGVIVRFLQDGEPVAMQVVDASGTAEKVLAKGDYTVDLAFSGDESGYYYDPTGWNLTADQTEIEVVLNHALTGEPVSLFAQGEETSGWNVGDGCTYVTLTAGERNYFLFTPVQAGTYEVSVAGEVEQLGYYGAPHFICEDTISEVTDNAFTVSISASMIGTGGGGTTVLVIGIDAGSAEDCVLCVERIGEPEHTIEDEPWTEYAPTVDLTPYTLPDGAVIHEFDLTAPTGTYNLVYNEQDGYYHLDTADGPLVLVRLAAENQYMDCYQKVLENAGVRKYFFDENGEYVKKEEYSNCLLAYLECVDENNGVYPMTEDLKYIIQQSGDGAGWFEEGEMTYLFKDTNGNDVPGINAEISWLFMCCYMTEG